MKKVFAAMAAAALALLWMAAAAQGAPVQWSGNGHWYELVDAGEIIAWSAADTAAQGSSYLGLQGHLATTTSGGEQVFLYGLYGTSNAWGLWIGGFQPSGSDEPGGGWSWVTGEPFAYTNWNPVEPNEANGDEDENWLMVYPTSGDWNDYVASGQCIAQPEQQVRGYVVEYEPVPEPSSLLALLTGAAGLCGLALRKRE